MKSKSPKLTQLSIEQDQVREKTEESTEAETQQILEDKDIFNKNWKHKSSHHKYLIIGNIEEGIHTKSKDKRDSTTLALISKKEPKGVEEALTDES